ncbi:DNA cytosine methyltransferase [Bacillus stercoris]|uniref:DNA cytosine methyltransferase n=1 Tax=Bacillus stercoris TaxID=2054641 RepID=UPI00403339CF
MLIKGKKRLKKLKINSFNFNWSEQVSTSKRLKDLLETYVDEKYYLNEDKTAKLIEELSSRDLNMKETDECQLIGRIELRGHDAIRRVYSPEGVSPTLTTMGGGHREPKIVVEQVGNINPSGNGMNGNVYNSSGLSPTITTNKGEGLKIAVEYSRKSGLGRELDISHTLSASDWRGLNRNQKQNAVVEVRPVLTPEREEKRQNGRRFKDDGEPAFTVNTIDRHGVAIGEYPKYRIRKLTPLECFRLQAFDDEDFEKAFAAGISNSQLYKQAGNSITVTVLESIFKELIHTYVNKESE